MSKLSVHVKYFLKEVLLTLGRDVRNLLCRALNNLGYVFFGLAIYWLMDATRYAPRGSWQLFILMEKRMPLAYAVNCIGMAFIHISTVLKTKNGWKELAWRDLLHILIPFSAISNEKMIGEVRRIHLLAMANQRLSKEQLTAEYVAALEEAARNPLTAHEAGEMLRRMYPRPQRCYMASLAIVFAASLSTRLEACATQEQRATVQRCSIHASVAKAATCHPPPDKKIKKPVSWKDNEPALLVPSDQPLFEDLVGDGTWQAFLAYLVRSKAPPWKSIDHVPKPFPILRQLIAE